MTKKTIKSAVPTLSAKLIELGEGHNLRKLIKTLKEEYKANKVGFELLELDTPYYIAEGGNITDKPKSDKAIPAFYDFRIIGEGSFDEWLDSSKANFITKTTAKGKQRLSADDIVGMSEAELIKLARERKNTITVSGGSKGGSKSPVHPKFRAAREAVENVEESATPANIKAAEAALAAYMPREVNGNRAGIEAKQALQARLDNMRG